MSRCPVCREEIAGARLRCRGCETAHHPDCWSWAGGCSRYGCGSRRAVVRRPMDLAELIPAVPIISVSLLLATLFLMASPAFLGAEGLGRADPLVSLLAAAFVLRFASDLLVWES